MKGIANEYEKTSCQIYLFENIKIYLYYTQTCFLILLDLRQVLTLDKVLTLNRKNSVWKTLRIPVPKICMSECGKIFMKLFKIIYQTCKYNETT